MKTKTILSLVILLLVSFSTLTTLAQEEEKKNQPFVVLDDFVNPSMVMQYEETSKEFMAGFAEQQYPYPMYVHSTEDFHYYWVTPIENMAELDSIRSLVNKIYSSDEEKWDAMWEKFEGTYQYTRQQIVVYMSELSYIPEEPRLKPESAFHVFL